MSYLVAGLEFIERFFAGLSTGEWLMILVLILVIGGMCLRGFHSPKSL